MTGNYSKILRPVLGGFTKIYLTNHTYFQLNIQIHRQHKLTLRFSKSLQIEFNLAKNRYTMRITQIIKFSIMNTRNTIMKNTLSKMMTASVLSCMAIGFAHAADENTSKAEVKKQIQVCAKKKQGDWVTYANKGVTFNGTCEPNENGKLQFSFPAPPAGSNTTGAAAAPEPAMENRPAVEQAAPASADAPATNDASQAEQPAVEQPSQAVPSEDPIQAQ